MHKLIAIALLTLMGLPFASTLLALTPQSDVHLPACCRRTGKHHCAMDTASQAGTESKSKTFSAPLEKCPYAPAALIGTGHAPAAFMPAGERLVLAVETHPTSIAQAESKQRISRDRSRQKRGPPAISL